MSLVRLLGKKTDKILYTTPSHGQKCFIYEPLKEVYKMDISETECHDPQEALEMAQLEAGLLQQFYLVHRLEIRY